jgi:hypothetical protein
VSISNPQLDFVLSYAGAHSGQNSTYKVQTREVQTRISQALFHNHPRKSHNWHPPAATSCKAVSNLRFPLFVGIQRQPSFSIYDDLSKSIVAPPPDLQSNDLVASRVHNHKERFDCDPWLVGYMFCKSG